MTSAGGGVSSQSQRNQPWHRPPSHAPFSPPAASPSFPSNSYVAAGGVHHLGTAHLHLERRGRSQGISILGGGCELRFIPRGRCHRRLLRGGVLLIEEEELVEEGGQTFILPSPLLRTKSAPHCHVSLTNGPRTWART